MKAGILTFHKAYNYGAILQAFAIQQAIANIGCESEIIDYVSEEKRRQIKLLSYYPGISFKDNLIKFVKDLYRLSKNKEFDEFARSYLKVSADSFSTFQEMEKMDKKSLYDVYIVGSDQVWNPGNNLKDTTFLLSFVSDDRKKCSYAASIGHVIFDNDLSVLYKNELSKFRVLTVREKSAIEEYSFLNGSEARSALDPTLLLEQSDYNSISNTRLIKKPYAFLYTISKDRSLRKLARKFCKEQGIILIDSKRSIQFFCNSSPSDFISFIKNADYVFTNSFHGTAFSVIYEKQFVTELNTCNNINTRSKDLMEKLGLLDRDMDSFDFDIDAKIDWKNVNEKKKILQEDSFKYLKLIMKQDMYG